MTNAQRQTYAKLQNKVKEAYKALHQNTDRSKHDALAQRWVDATVKADNYMMKYL